VGILKKLTLGAGLVMGFAASQYVQTQAAIRIIVSNTGGCAALNGQTATGVSVYDSGKFSGFKAGDKITATTSVASSAITAGLYDTNTGSLLVPYTDPSFTYTVTTTTASDVLSVRVPIGEATFNITVTCTPATVPGTPSTGPGIQQTASQTSGQNSQSNINDILDQVIPGTQGNTFNPVSGNAGGMTMMVAPGQTVAPVADAPHSLQSDSAYRMFMAGRYTHASGAETGDQFNGVFGLSRRMGEHASLGLFGGYEGFSYTDATSSNLSGNGLSIGAFAAGTFRERLKLDARAYTTFMNYNIATGATTGAFAAQRFGTSVTASYELGSGPVSFAPFVRGSGLFEWQNAYTNSAATAVAAQNLAQGQIAHGIRLSRAMAMSNGSNFTPYLAGEADYIFGNTTLAGFTGTTGFSGKVSAGANLTTFKGLSFGLDASYGGIGSSINSQSVMGTLTVPF